MHVSSMDSEFCEDRKERALPALSGQSSAKLMR
jgi:hypothetical protein